MSFKQIIVDVDSKEAELLSDIFFELGALSVSIEDKYEGTDLEQPIFNEPGMIVENLWEHSKLQILFASDCDVDSIVEQARKARDRNFEVHSTVLDDQDWVKLTQSQFDPIKISDKLYIVPSWHNLPDENAIGIILDPGLAFGTGSHPTTFMCLAWLAENISATDSVLDYGCGSGILAIAANKLGAKTVVGVDIDKQAIEASIYNASNNKAKIDFYLPNNFNHETKFDIVVANILSNPLRILAPMLSTQVKLGGTILLSGILESQIEELSQIYEQWFTMNVVRIMDGWVLFHGIKNLSN